MDQSKAKKAVSKSEKAKAMMAELMMTASANAPINPEIQVPQATMQPEDGYIDPYRPLGAIASGQYSPGNMMGGYNSSMFVNPEA